MFNEKRLYVLVIFFTRINNFYINVYTFYKLNILYIHCSLFIKLQETCLLIQSTVLRAASLYFHRGPRKCFAND